MKPIENWLATIGETDPEIRAAVLEACRTDPDACSYFAARATETENRPIETESTIPETESGENIMSLTVTEGATGTYEPCPAGSYLARCVRIIDLGTQETEYQGEIKYQPKALLAWEVLDDEARRDDGTPFLLSKRYTASLHAKAALRGDLASWRGRDFTPEELAGFNLKNVLGRECFLSVVHAEKDGKTFANIAAIMKPPKGAAAPEGCGQEEPLLWDMQAPDWSVFAKLPKRAIEQIEASPEFKALKPPASVQLGQAPAPAAGAANPLVDLADDCPF